MFSTESHRNAGWRTRVATAAIELPEPGGWGSEYSTRSLLPEEFTCCLQAGSCSVGLVALIVMVE
jgi:hypothetical protein